ncbi:MAG: GNAT family N-acetyltransferase [Clostridiales bacterium]|nr:GNAT family N-acetyltransferase [Clostridiales bacterium]
MKPIGTQPIRTQRLCLRPPRLSDAEGLIHTKAMHLPLEEVKRRVAGMVDEISKPFVYQWVITLDDAPIGRIKAWDVNPYNGYLQLGYDIGPDNRNRGLMTEAVKAVLHYLLMQADAHRVFCSVREGNLASRRVCEKCGMRHEGTLREHYARQDGGYDDVLIYAILRQEWEQRYGDRF